MELFYLNFVVGALFMIVGAIFYTNNMDTLGVVWFFVSMAFIVYGVLSINGILANTCYSLQ